MSRNHIRRWLGTSIITLAAAAACPGRAATPQQVQKAIEKAQQFLLTHRSPDGTWEQSPRPELSVTADQKLLDFRGRQWGGLTAVSTYALLASGADQRSPEMKTPINFLLTANLQGTYAVGISSQLVLFLPERETREFARRNLALLYGGLISPPPNMVRSPQMWTDQMGFYTYYVGTPQGSNEPLAGNAFNPRNPGIPQPVGWWDRSNSQYAVLGMWALAESGGEIRNLYWQIEDLAWKRGQMKDGGWNYNPATPGMNLSSPSMTAAGIATLFITQDYTMEENWSSCHGGVRNEFIERGLQWMDQHIDQVFGNYYTMYGIERIGTASGRRYFGTKDWYQIGADFLVTHQNPDGSWAEPPPSVIGPIPNTGFGLLFLARGRAPVMMNKLQYEAGTDKNALEAWNERPRDAANLAKWAGKQDEAYYNWQVVNLRVTAEELHDAPILYISGSQPLKFSAEDEAKLRTYVQEGGMILGNADCGKDPFSKSFQELGKRLFPEYTWRPVAPTDFIFTEQFKDIRPKPKLLELTNGIRKLMVLIPEADASKAWQVHSIQNGGLFGLGTNLFLYATDKKNLFTKGDTYWATPNPAIPPTGALKIARLNVGSNPNPEPAGWVRMNAIMHNRFRTDLSVELIKPEALSSGYQVADLTGTGKFTFSPAERAAIKQFVGGGGTLIVDAAGGDVVFADAAESELNSIFGAKTEALDDTHVVYNVPGDKLEKVGWRKFVGDRIPDKHRAQLRGITIDGRTAVFFSREDLSEGIVGEPVDGILGYDPATATDLMTAMLVYAQYGGKPPAMAPPPVATAPVPPQPPATVPPLSH
jgi:hypothetical protein